MPTESFSGKDKYLTDGLPGFPDEMPCGIVILDTQDFHIRSCNTVFLQLMGYSAGEIAGPLSFLSLLDPLQHHRLSIQLSRARDYKSKRKRYVIYHLRHKDGRVCSYSIYAAPLEDGPGSQVFQLVIMPEFTDWSLPFTSYDTREIFLELFEDFGFGTYEWIIGPGKVFCSDSVYPICGIDPRRQELTARMVIDLLHPEDKQMVMDAIRRTFETGEPYNIETRIITPQRRIKYINSIGRLIKSEQGEVLKLVGGVRDITQQKESEMAREKHFSELNRSNRELEDFAYVTSHDLQEPLRKISTFSDRLTERSAGHLDDEGSFYLERIRVSASNMRQLINNLLDFSRVTEGNLAFSRTDLNFILREVRSDLELKVAETESVIRAESLPVIEADPSQMRQLLLNLIGNALKFRKPDQVPQIDITVRELNDDEQMPYQFAGRDGKYYRIEIRDNGIGFEDEYATRIFQIFQRLHGKAEYPGSGIGLAICKKIVDYHHGFIFAERLPPPGGACFTLILPERQAGLV